MQFVIEQPTSAFFDRPLSTGQAIQETKSVVIIDDDHMLRQILKFIVNSGAYQVVGEASNGNEAIEVCEKLQPDLILLDINMPKMSGLLALEMIRKWCAASKVVMVSADSQKAKVETAIKRGASGFVIKPFNAANVITRIDSCFPERKSSDQANWQPRISGV